MQGSPCALSPPRLFPSLPLPLRPLSRRTPSQGQPPTQAANCSCNDLPSTSPAGHHQDGGLGEKGCVGTEMVPLAPSRPLLEGDGSEMIHLPHLTNNPPTQSLRAPPHLSVDDHHTHKHAEEHKGGKQDKDDGERAAQNQIPGIQLLLQVCPAIDLLRQGE